MHPARDLAERSEKSGPSRALHGDIVGHCDRCHSGRYRSDVGAGLARGTLPSRFQCIFSHRRGRGGKGERHM